MQSHRTPVYFSNWWVIPIHEDAVKVEGAPLIGGNIFLLDIDQLKSVFLNVGPHNFSTLTFVNKSWQTTMSVMCSTKKCTDDLLDTLKVLQDHYGEPNSSGIICGTKTKLCFHQLD